MVTVTIHGVSMTTSTQRVITACNELGIKFKIVAIDLATGEHKSPEYVETKQPFGATPVLVDEDGTQLFESRAIARYLVAKYGKDSGLVPDQSDLKAYGLFEQAASIEYSIFEPNAGPLTYERVFPKMLGRQTDEKLAEKYTANLNAKLEGYERILSKQKYLAGNIGENPMALTPLLSAPEQIGFL
ncbi:Glutathione S-transferase PM239X14 OS=Arabidopsis thaliana PE=2 SV=1 [Rhizoctonia solani AG-1 IB]|uniref:glutathione transferase n=1 Tax=Thanatephorus cucumeris (strain AG1-IB / isolate 7/3/14) TaxID=1108050 RepID=A0A0B7FJ71_THACB|nr:Glutathione S-transferase PM239X14 OS=Arabidopsis thaliana PE=2 SV=1 [Rhizoctonia solani AG-1 IB]